ncbi:MAG TPA: tyrosine-type recombinase/integrase [Acetobacteraceae bacterium]|nr:tyrosine-type recombinase/integrase [Acetobacteraceae bacterium]
MEQTMVRARYPYLIQQRRRWFVRLVVPPDVRDIVGQAIFKIATGETDQHRAATMAAPIIADLQHRIAAARDAGKRPEQITAEQLAERYCAERKDDPEQAEMTRIEDVIAFALRAHGHNWRAYGRRVVEAGYDAHAALRLLPDDGAAATTTDRITGNATPLLLNLDKWKPHAGLKPRPLDQAVASINEFARAIRKPIQRITGADVQRWIEALINPDAESGLTAKTVNRKLAEIRNYWRWMQAHEIIALDHNPFAGRMARDPAHRRKGKDEKRQRFQPNDVVRCWTAAEQRGDAPLAAAIQIAAYSGARIEGAAQLRTTDIRVDPETQVRFMRMDDKTAAGDRYVPIHPKIARLIDRLIASADADGYLIHSTAKNKYGERSQPIGKRFGRLKSDLGFDGRYVFHSIRKTIAHLLETAECPPGVAKDIIGHAKTDMTFGIYSGETRMDHRARWLSKAIRYQRSQMPVVQHRLERRLFLRRLPH